MHCAVYVLGSSEGGITKSSWSIFSLIFKIFLVNLLCWIILRVKISFTSGEMLSPVLVVYQELFNYLLLKIPEGELRVAR